MPAVYRGESLVGDRGSPTPEIGTGRDPSSGWEACGICHTDLEEDRAQPAGAAAHLRPTKRPAWVAAVGSAVKQVFARATRVGGLPTTISLHEYVFTAGAKFTAQCPVYKKGGYHTAGFRSPPAAGFAQYVRVMDWNRGTRGGENTRWHFILSAPHWSEPAEHLPQKLVVQSRSAAG